MVDKAHSELVQLLQRQPDDRSLGNRVIAAEIAQPADLTKDAELLEGVWELRWSSSKQPWLKQAPWLDNLQVLDPFNKRGCNLLRLRGPLGSIGGICVQANLQIINVKRVEVRFIRGGWVIGSQLLGKRRLPLMREIKQRSSAWLDITVLDRQLRICRGNAGTIFALLKREDICISDFFV
ncbi:PAP/fibrillin family protein [Synechococcus sp. M16CYN]|uniref:PAP/fibrillin family protein n=1 Tax=Synechococcus sp. M16CYN TaxID=3103139 RepID=UPI00325181D7